MIKFRTVFILAFIIFVHLSVEARDEVNIAPIGAHYPVFIVEKNENPQNILVAYTKLNSKCEIELDGKSKAPIFDFYWLMDRKNFKPVNRLIVGGIRERLASEGKQGTDRHSFRVRVNDLKELNQDLGQPSLEVIGRAKTQGGCEVLASMQLGPSDKNVRLRLESIYSEGSKTFLPPFRKVVAVTLIGTDYNAPKRPVRRKYVARE